LLPDGNESTGQLPVGDRRSVTLGVDAPPDPYQGPVPGHAGFDDRRPVIATRAPLYEASPLEAVVNLLRPSGTKVFLGFAVLVLAAVSAQALGLVDLPIIGDGSGDQTVAAGDITTTSSVVTTATSSTAVASDPTRFGAGDETTSSSATTAAPTTAAETTASTGATVEEPTSTAATEPEPTEPSGPSSTDSSTSTPDPGSTVEPDPTVTVLPNDTLEPGQSYLVPDDVPAGTYVGQVGPNATCSITIERAGAGIEELTVEGGDRVRVELADGDRVTAGEGCPRLRARQPEE
jgi:hypothetical protein